MWLPVNLKWQIAVVSCITLLEDMLLQRVWADFSLLGRLSVCLWFSVGTVHKLIYLAVLSSFLDQRQGQERSVFLVSPPARSLLIQGQAKNASHALSSGFGWWAGGLPAICLSPRMVALTSSVPVLDTLWYPGSSEEMVNSWEPHFLCLP